MKGGKTDVYKDNSLYFSGQYFPDRMILWAPKFKATSILESIQESINNTINPKDIVFPYYGK